MKMKTRFLLVPLALASASCDNFLMEEPDSFVAPTNFWNTAEDALTAVNAAYRDMYDRGGVNRHFIIMTDGNADDLHIVVGADRIAIDLFRHAAQNEVLDDMWRGYYSGINRTNGVIDHVPGIEMNAQLRDRIVGEAKFLRATYYFYLVRWFGDVPLTTKETTSLQGLQVTKSPSSAVYDQVVADLRAAVDVLPLSYGGQDIGRATKGSARTMLAKVYMTQRKWDLAREQLDAVIQSRQYDLFPTYADVFDIKNENRVEHIHMFQHKQGASGSLKSGYMTAYLTQQSGMGHGTFIPVRGQTGLYDTYESGDRRKELYLVPGVSYTDPLGRRINPDAVYVFKYNDPDGTSSNQDLNFPLLRYADVLLMYAETLNEIGGPSAPAYDAINRIRRRAGLADLPAGLSQAAFRDAVRRERRAELAYEGHRWFDLQRWDETVPVMQRQMADLKTGSSVGAHHKLFPIPQIEMDANPNLTQNPGY